MCYKEIFVFCFVLDFVFATELYETNIRNTPDFLEACSWKLQIRTPSVNCTALIYSPKLTLTLVSTSSTELQAAIDYIKQYGLQTRHYTRLHYSCKSFIFYKECESLNLLKCSL